VTRRWLTLIVALAVAARTLTWWFQGGFHYPDEIFQQLEPANWLRTGVGWLPWEFDRGLRSLMMPWFYAGGLEVLSWAGVVGRQALRAVNLHNALWTVLMVPAGFRMGRALASGRGANELGDRAGLLTAAMMALLPTLDYFTPHALMGTPSMLALTWGLAFWAEERATARFSWRPALWTGFFLGLSGVIRFTTGLFMLVPIADIVLRRRRRGLAALALGGLPWVVLLGALDQATWGQPFHSVIEHFKYNYLEGGASHHGTSPWDFYWRVSLAERLSLGLVPAAFFAAVGMRRVGWLALNALLGVALLSSIAHKEERFVMYVWPQLAAIIGVGAAVTWQWIGGRSPRAAAWVVPGLLAVVVGANLWGTSKLPWRWRAGLFQAQDFAGDRPDCAGLLVEGRQHLNGGYLVFHRTVPMISYSRELALQRPYNYAALREDGGEDDWLETNGWSRVAAFEGVVVLRRTSPER
jgi:phosphatidylinositol glycan class B